MASPVDTSVKFYREDFPGAPVLNGVAGSLIGLLDACLCTGFGLRSATSLVVAGGVATLTLGSDAKNGNLLHSVILVDGVTGALTALNGEQRVTAASSTELKFATAAADGTATGSITVKTAPAGWEKKFSDTNKAVFKSLAVEANTSYLQVKDTGTTSANVRAYEAMTDVDTGTGAAPTVAQLASGGYWAKSAAANVTPIGWDLFSDARAFYYCPTPYTAYGTQYIGQGCWFYGDPIAFKGTDAFSTAIFFGNQDNSQYTQMGSVFHTTNADGPRVARGYSGLGASVPCWAKPQTGTSVLSGDDGFLGAFPSQTDGALLLSEYILVDTAFAGAQLVRRGRMPGARHAPQSNLGVVFSRKDTVTVGGKRFYVTGANTSAYDSGAAGGRMFFDITGPWR